MTYLEFNEYCKSLKSTTYVVQWGGAHVWKIGGKVFAIGGWNKDSGTEAYTFKVSELNFDVLKEQPGFRPAPYLASRGFKWIQQFDTDSKLNKQLQYYLSESYQMVAKGLSQKRQKELGL